MDQSRPAIKGELNNDELKKQKPTEILVLTEKGRVCIFDKNLRKVNVSFKTKKGVCVILIDLMGDECNFL